VRRHAERRPSAGLLEGRLGGGQEQVVLLRVAAKAADRSPSGSQTKFAWLVGTSTESLRSASVTRSRSAMTSAQRRLTSSSCASAASAAAWATRLVENGVDTLRSAAATSGCATR
jgi:hypothetical protein